MNRHIVLDCWFPGIFGAGSNAGIEKGSHLGINSRPDGKNLIPDTFRVQGSPKVIGDLFADRVPVGFDNRVVFFVIIPDRACMNPDEFRDGYLLFLRCQGDSSYTRWESW